MNAAECQREIDRKTVGSLGLKAVLRECLRQRILPSRAHVLLFLSESNGSTDYIRLGGTVVLNEELAHTVTFCLNQLSFDEKSARFNISRKVLERFPLTVVVSREKISDGAFEALKQLKCDYPQTRIWVDIDDDLFSIDKSHPEFEHYKQRVEILKDLVKLSNVVTVSTEGVKRGLVQEGCDESVVHIIPNYLDDRIWKLDVPRGRFEDPTKVHVLYSGTETHDADLEMVIPALEIARKRIKELTGKDLEVTIVGGSTKRFEGLSMMHVPDSKRLYAFYVPWVQGMGPFDIAIAPLELSNKLNWAKSDLKFLEYSALGLPTVFTEIDPYVPTVKDGVNGFLIHGNSVEAWTEALVSLACDDALAQRISEQCYVDLTEGLLLSQHFRDWKDVIEPVEKSS